MNNGLISIRYANALFRLGQTHEGLLDILYNDCNNVYYSLKESEELRLFLRNPVIKPGIKKSFFRKGVKTLLNDFTLKFIDLVINNNREKLLQSMILDFTDLYRKYKGIKHVTIICAVAVDESFKEKISGIIEQQLNCKVELDWKVDEAILGGLVVMIDGKQADGSIAGKLRALKKKMMIK